MTPDAFRSLALKFPDLIESAHMNHPDFRVRGKIFATLGYPSDEFATIMLTPTEQAQFVKDESGAFAPVKGGWGLKGTTNVRLKLANAELVNRALSAAWTRKACAATRPRRSAAPRKSRR